MIGCRTASCEADGSSVSGQFTFGYDALSPRSPLVRPSLSGATGVTDTYTYKPFGITTATGSNPNRAGGPGKPASPQRGVPQTSSACREAPLYGPEPGKAGAGC